MALGVPVIVVQGGSSINQNPIPIDVDKSIWDECENQDDFANAFRRLYLKKNRKEQIKAAKIVREKYFEPVSAFSVNQFLENNN